MVRCVVKPLSKCEEIWLCIGLLALSAAGFTLMALA